MNRCSACESDCRFVPGDGPTPCDWLVIGEKPGKSEAEGGRPFIGMSGAEFNNHYLGLAGLSRDDIRITNTVHCRLGGNNNKPDDKQIAAGAGHHMPGEVAECQPKCIVLMGATACSLVPKIELDKDHGIPIFIDDSDSAYLGGYCGPVVPMLHPASGLHDTSQMIHIMEDFERLGKWWRGKWMHATPPVKPYYRLLRGHEVTDITMRAVVRRPKRSAVDCEDDCGIPWSVQFSTKPNEGFMVRTNDAVGMRHLKQFIEAEDEITLHNSPGDLDDLEKLGIRVKRYQDTMQCAYHLGNQPQGLKALGWRLLGIRMRSWEDVVGPPSRAKMIDWLSARWDRESDNRIRVEKQLKTKLKIEYKPTDAERAIKRILSHAHKPEYDLWEKADEASIVGTEMPRMSIANVPLDEAIQYACQDADVTGQVGAVLARMRSELVREGGAWSVDEGDWDQ